MTGAAGPAALHQLAADCAAYPDAARRVILPAVGAMMVEAATIEAARVGGRLSRYNRGAGARLTASAVAAGGDTIRLTPRPLGPWSIVEAGSARSSWIQGAPPGPRRHGKRLRLASGAVRWYVRHGPVRGRRAWTRAKTSIVDQLPATVHTGAVQAWVEVR